MHNFADDIRLIAREWYVRLQPSGRFIELSIRWIIRWSSEGTYIDLKIFFVPLRMKLHKSQDIEFPPRTKWPTQSSKHRPLCLFWHIRNRPSTGTNIRHEILSEMSMHFKTIQRHSRTNQPKIALLLSVFVMRSFILCVHLLLIHFHSNCSLNRCQCMSASVISSES